MKIFKILVVLSSIYIAGCFQTPTKQPPKYQVEFEVIKIGRLVKSDRKWYSIQDSMIELKFLGNYSQDQCVVDIIDDVDGKLMTVDSVIINCLKDSIVTLQSNNIIKLRYKLLGVDVLTYNYRFLRDCPFFTMRLHQPDSNAVKVFYISASDYELLPNTCQPSSNTE